MAKKDLFTRKWIVENSLEEMQNYEKGDLTLRGLYYRLVSRGMTNTLLHYKRVVSAMIEARWEDVVDFDVFSDHDREIIGETPFQITILENEVEKAKGVIEAWLKYYNKNRWENQPYYPEVFIEKKALLGVFNKVCSRNSVALGACKGYPSLTFLYDTAKRIQDAEEAGKQPVILYFGDYDPSGEDIPRSIKENLIRMGCSPDIELRREMLLENQVVEWGLPPAPIKPGDSRSKDWKGLGQVELDAVEPNKIKNLCQDAIDDVLDQDLYEELQFQEGNEEKEYQSNLRNFVENYDFDEE